MYISIYVIEDSSVSDMLLKLPQPLAGASLQLVPIIPRACSSVVLSKFQHLTIRTVQQN